MFTRNTKLLLTHLFLWSDVRHALQTNRPKFVSQSTLTSNFLNQTLLTIHTKWPTKSCSAKCINYFTYCRTRTISYLLMFQTTNTLGKV